MFLEFILLVLHGSNVNKSSLVPLKVQTGHEKLRSDALNSFNQSFDSEDGTPISSVVMCCSEHSLSSHTVIPVLPSIKYHTSIAALYMIVLSCSHTELYHNGDVCVKDKPITLRDR